MSTPQTSRDDRSVQPTFILAGPSGVQVDISLNSWMVATVIEDDDLTFGGKPLSTWYEEERRRQSLGSFIEQERRGRTRERPVTLRHEEMQHKHHHHNHHHHHHHQPETKNKDGKP